MLGYTKTLAILIASMIAVRYFMGADPVSDGWVSSTNLDGAKASVDIAALAVLTAIILVPFCLIADYKARKRTRLEGRKER
jgi:hypothetical protein